MKRTSRLSLILVLVLGLSTLAGAFVPVASATGPARVGSAFIAQTGAGTTCTVGPISGVAAGETVVVTWSEFGGTSSATFSVSDTQSVITAGNTHYDGTFDGSISYTGGVAFGTLTGTTAESATITSSLTDYMNCAIVVYSGTTGVSLYSNSGSGNVLSLTTSVSWGTATIVVAHGLEKDGCGAYTCAPGPYGGPPLTTIPTQNTCPYQSSVEAGGGCTADAIGPSAGVGTTFMQQFGGNTGNWDLWVLILGTAPAQATQCNNGALACYQNGPTARATSGTTLTATLTGANFSSTFVSAPFTEVVVIAAASGSGTSLIVPTSVISSDFGDLSDSAVFSPSGGTMTAFAQGFNYGVAKTVYSSSLTLSFWYVQVPAGTADASDTLTATFSSIPSQGALMLTGIMGGKYGASYLPAAWWVTSFYSPGYPPGTKSPTTATSSPAADISSQAVVTGFTATSVETKTASQSLTYNAPFSAASQCPLDAVRACGEVNANVSSWSSAYGVSNNLWAESLNFSSYSGTFSATYQPPTSQAVVYDGAAVFIEWNPTGGSSSCSGAGCSGTSGTSVATTTYHSVASNVTFFFVGQTTVQAGIMITNVTVKLEGTSFTGVRSLTVAIYQVEGVCPSGHTCGGESVVGNLNPISGSNPLVRVSSQTYPFGTGASVQYVHFLPVSVAILNGTWYALSVSVNHNGFSLYNATSGNMYEDTGDGYDPSQITGGSAVTPPFFLQYSWFMPSVTVKVTNTVVGGSSSPSTPNLFSNPGGLGAAMIAVLVNGAGMDSTTAGYVWTAGILIAFLVLGMAIGKGNAYVLLIMSWLGMSIAEMFNFYPLVYWIAVMAIAAGLGGLKVIGKLV